MMRKRRIEVQFSQLERGSGKFVADIGKKISRNKHHKVDDQSKGLPVRSMKETQQCIWKSKLNKWDNEAKPI